MNQVAIVTGGTSGIAPFCVQTNAETFTAMRCACGRLMPSMSCETRVAVKESPAPTVSATSACGVGRTDFSLLSQTLLCLAPYV